MTGGKAFSALLVLVLAEPALRDLKTYRVRERGLLVYSYVGILTAFIRTVWLGDIMSWPDAMLLTGILLLLYFFGKGQIGEADIWVLGGLPLYTEGGIMWEILAHASVLLLAASIASYAEERNKKTGLPFIPFLWAGMLITWGGEWIGQYF